MGDGRPFLRRLFGNSFVPYHDYGRGGRGWRDLWQDCLALLMLEPEPVHDLLFSSFVGVRMDGSNATIIGSRPGEFMADRNNIPQHLDGSRRLALPNDRGCTLTVAATWAFCSRSRPISEKDRAHQPLSGAR